MATIKLTIDGQNVEVAADATILQAARKAGIYIPTLCHHPDLPAAKGQSAAAAIYQGDHRFENSLPGEEGKGCGLCLVALEGESDLVRACSTNVRDSIVVMTSNDQIQKQRRDNLMPILARHPHACLTCAQQEGCSRTQCSTNVAQNERCCPQFGHCELQDVANYIGISDATAKWIPTDLPLLKNDPLYERDYNLCIGCTRCVRACNDLRGVKALGFVYDKNQQVQVGTLAPHLAESGCKFCTACVEVCPTGALTDKSVRAAKKEADLVPCKAACPVHIDIPAYIRLIYQGRAADALAVIREKVPLPGVLGRVCLHPCEDACRRGEINAPVAICALKRFAADYGAQGEPITGEVVLDSGKRVAIVGAGPAGLTAAFYLRKKGHRITLFDSQDQAGGMLRYGIPAYRLPRAVLDAEISAIFKLGIDFQPNRRMGQDFGLEQLNNDGYNAVFLAIGVQLSKRIPIKGCDLNDVLWGIDFLRDVSAGKSVQLKENVVVIGGGNVAVDIALTAFRCGALNVSLACLEDETEMPASQWEIDRAIAEGVNLLPSRGPEKIISKNGQITGLDLVECTCVFDQQGNFCPQFNKDNKECLMVDQIILAVGQVPDLTFLDNGSPISTAGGLIVVDEQTHQTAMDRIWAGGDVTQASGAVIHAVAAGRKAASSIDLTLGGDGQIDEVLFERPVAKPFIGADEGFADWQRVAMPEIELDGRHQAFTEIAKGYDTALVVREARRCIQCDLRLNLGCNPRPPAVWLAFTRENIKKVPAAEGVYQLLDENHQVMTIKGTADIRQELLCQLEENANAAFFEFEEDKLYSKRESELIQKYLQEHGAMPGQDDEMDDLF